MEQNNNKPKPNQLSEQADLEEEKDQIKEDPEVISIPDLEDITGLDSIPPDPAGNPGDLTLTSAEKEGDNLLDNELDLQIRNDPESNVSRQEKDDLRTAANDMPGDDEELRDAALDSTDEDGTPLNEGSFDKNISPSDLDVPGSGLDDAEEDIGSEDEENNEYSLGGDDHPDN